MKYRHPPPRLVEAPKPPADPQGVALAQRVIAERERRADRDQLVEQWRRTLRSVHSLGRAIEVWFRMHPDEIPPETVLFAMRERRETLEGVERLRLAQSKNALQERIAKRQERLTDEQRMEAARELVKEIEAEMTDEDRRQIDGARKLIAEHSAAGHDEGDGERADNSECPQETHVAMPERP